MRADEADRIQQLEARLNILSTALREFAEATTDYQRLLDVVAHRLAEVVKDACVVRLLSPAGDGWLTAAAIDVPLEKVSDDPNVQVRLRTHIAAPHNLAEQPSARRLLETGETLLVPHFDLNSLRATATPEIAAAYQTIGIHSLLMIPLRVRGQSLGLLSLFRFLPTSPAFTENDRELAQALGDRAALAISNATLVESVTRELAERRRAEEALHKTEEQLRHAQKMEAVGRLAGSVAHDFNNLLSVILSYSELTLDALKPIDPLRAEIEAIKKAGEKASDLTRQLLAFSRQQILAPRIVDLNKVIEDSERMLRRLIGEDIALQMNYGSGIARVKVDPGQIDQVILNLAINARDAMPAGGKLTIETMNVTLDASYTTAHFGVAVGPHVMLAVTDSGVGMDAATQARIFEPFFTTKELGKGTGLGLSTVFGIVQQSGGTIWVYSEPGGGTTFKVYFPVAEGEDAPPVEAVQLSSLHGTETILLVEDQEEVRKVALQILKRYGYHVIEAGNAGEALLSCERHARTIHLLLTDVVMPQMSGRELAERLLQLRPEMKVLYMSGYTENTIVHHGILDSGIAYVQKPILPEMLGRRVREVLETPVRRSTTRPPPAP